jgi:hypothetical protein
MWQVQPLLWSNAQRVYHATAESSRFRRCQTDAPADTLDFGLIDFLSIFYYYLQLHHHQNPDCNACPPSTRVTNAHYAPPKSSRFAVNTALLLLCDDFGRLGDCPGEKNSVTIN